MATVTIGNTVLEDITSDKVIKLNKEEISNLKGDLSVELPEGSSYQVLLSEQPAGDVIIKVTNADGTTFDIIFQNLATIYEESIGTEAGDIIAQLMITVNGESLTIANYAELLEALEATAAGEAPGQNGAIDPTGGSLGIDPSGLGSGLGDNPDGFDRATLGDEFDANARPIVADVTLLSIEVKDGINIITGQLVVSDTDPNDTHTFNYVAGTFSVTSSSGVISIDDDDITFEFNEDGSFTITGDFNDLAVGENATVSFDYTATDSGTPPLTSNTATVTLNISGTNDQPVVEDVSLNDIVGYEVEQTHTITTEAGETIGYTYFTVTEAGTVTITTDGPTIDPNMYLLYNDGDISSDDIIAYNDDGWTPAGAWYNSMISVYLEPGQYIIAVSDYQLSEDELVNNFNNLDDIAIMTGDVTLTLTSTTPLIVENAKVLYETYDSEDVIGAIDTQDETMNLYSGQLSVTDDDDTDTHTFHLAEDGVVVTDSPLNSEGDPVITLDNLSITINLDGTYTVGGDFNDLAVGETATVTVEYYALDDNLLTETAIHESSESEHKYITFTITGTNDQPIVTPVENVVSEESLGDYRGLVEDSVYNGSVSGAVIDDDENDTHTFAIDQGTLTLSLTTTNQAFLSLFSLETLQQIEGMVNNNTTINEILDFIVTNADGDNVADSVTLETAEGYTIPQNIITMLTHLGLLTINMDASGDYTIKSPLFNLLGANDSLTLSFDYRATDNAGITADDGLNELSQSEASTVTLTILGTNDQPVAYEADYTALESELATTGIDTATGSVNATFSGLLPGASTGNVLSDIYTRVQITNVKPGMDEDLFDAATLKFYLEEGTVETAVREETRADQRDGVTVIDETQTKVIVNEDGSFSVTNPTFDNLAVGETATVTFKYYVDDQSGAEPTEFNEHESTRSEAVEVTVTITGTNDQPLVENIVMGVDDVIYESRDNKWYKNGEDDTQDDFATVVFGKLVAYDDDVNDEHVFNVRDYRASDYYGHGGVGSHEDQGDVRFDTVSFYQKGSHDDPVNVKMMITSSDVKVGHLDVSSLTLMNNDASDSEVDFKLEGNFNALGVGETATVTFEYIANDKRGFGQDGDVNNEASISEAKTVTITITGTNDQPIVEDVVFDSVPVSYNVLALSEGATMTIEDLALLPQRFKVNFSLKLDNLDDGTIMQRGGESDAPTIEIVNGQLVFTMDTTTGSEYQLTYDIDANQWYDISYVLKHGELTLIVNGEEVSSITVDGNMPELSDTTMIIGGENSIDGYIDNIDFRDAFGSIASYDFEDHSDTQGLLSDGAHIATITNTDLYSEQLGLDIADGTQPIFETHDETGDDAVDSNGDGNKTNDEGMNIFTGTLVATDDDDNDSHTFYFKDYNENSHSMVTAVVSGVVVSLSSTDASVNLYEIASNLSSLTLDNNGKSSADFTLSGDFSSLAANENVTITFKYYAVDNNELDGKDGINESSTSEIKTASITIVGTNDQPVVESLSYGIESDEVGSVYYETSQLNSDDESAGNILLGKLYVSDEDLSDSHEFVLKDMGGSFNNEKPEDVIDRYVDAYTSDEAEREAIKDSFMGKSEIEYIKSEYSADDANRSDDGGETYQIKVAIFSSDLKAITGGGDHGEGELPINLESITLFEVDQSSTDNPNQSSVDFELKGDFSALAAGETATIVFRYKAIDDSDNTYDIYDGQNEENESAEGFITLTVTGTNDQPIIQNVEIEVDEVLTGLNSIEGVLGSDYVVDADLSDNVTFELVQFDPIINTAQEALYIVDGNSFKLVSEDVDVRDYLDKITKLIVNSDGSYSVEGDFNALPTDAEIQLIFQYQANDNEGFDGTNGQDETSLSEVKSVAITITGTNDAPVLSEVIEERNFVENSHATILDGLVHIDDVDDTTLLSATISISENYEQGADKLMIGNQFLANGVIATFDAVAGILTLSGEASIEDYESMLEHIKFINNSEDPSDEPRTITWVVNDGEANSIAQSTIVNVIPVNDAPIANDDTITKIVEYTPEQTEYVAAEDPTGDTYGSGYFGTYTVVQNSDGFYGIDQSHVSGSSSHGGDTSNQIDSQGTNEHITFNFAQDVTSATMDFKNADSDDNASYQLYNNGVAVGGKVYFNVTNGELAITSSVAFDSIVIYAEQADGLSTFHWTDFTVGNVVGSYTIPASYNVNNFTFDGSVLLANDTDVDSTLSLVDETVALYHGTTPIGTVTIVDGEVSVDLGQFDGFELTNDMDNAASFTYQVTDGQYTDTATATIDLTLGTVNGAEVTYDVDASDEIVIGSSGDDVIGFEEASAIDGGDGEDILRFDSSDGDIDMAAYLDGAIKNSETTQTSIQNIEEMDLRDGDHILSNLSLEDFVAMTDDDNTLKITGDGGDRVELDMAQWEVASNDTLSGNIAIDNDGDGFVSYTNSMEVTVGGQTYAAQSLNLLIDENIDVNS